MKTIQSILRLVVVALTALLCGADGLCAGYMLTNDSITRTILKDSVMAALPDTTLDTIAVRQFIVVNLESNVPIRDILVYTDDGQETKTEWDGTFSLRETFECINFAHPNYEKRQMLRADIDGDTIGLIPNLFALNEVVVYGHYRKNAINNSFKLSKIDAQLLQAHPQGFNIVAWALDKIWLKKVRHRKEMKKQKEKMILDNY